MVRLQRHRAIITFAVIVFSEPSCRRGALLPRATDRHITTASCCARHHATPTQRETIPMRVCKRHRMTKCNQCTNLSTCCDNHHVCHKHSRRACTTCTSLTGPRRTRLPAACCQRGHHEHLEGKPSHCYSSESSTNESDDDTQSSSSTTRQSTPSSSPSHDDHRTSQTNVP